MGEDNTYIQKTHLHSISDTHMNDTNLQFRAKYYLDIWYKIHL